MKILITGGAGFIGSHLVDALAELNHEIIVVDNCSANNEKFYFNEKATYHIFNICDGNELIKVSAGCDFCFHMAAETRIQDTINNPRKTVDTNILGTLNVLEACRQNKIKGMIFSSTSSIYGLTDQVPITELQKEDCLNPYASTKYAAELLIKNYNKLYGVKSCILRYFNVFGERAPSKGQYALVTAIFLRQKRNKEAITVVGDGLQERDFIYVKDIVSANIKCMNDWDTNTALTISDIFNIGYGKAITIIDLAKTITDDIIFVDKRKGEAKTNLSSSNKFVETTGWKPSTYVLDWIKTQ
jgi:UDP-glucose 4-epimerase